MKCFDTPERRILIFKNSDTKLSDTVYCILQNCRHLWWCKKQHLAT